ncbi:MAG: alanine:cation symporter family protein, partial [Gammaproteobacteria bacterium]|nr:alanine:cation symporter family protein [Gammaproteobacteria bacterium]
MEGFISTLNSIVWSPALIYLCLGAGLFYSILTRFAQVRHFKEMCKLMLNNSESDKGISSFQALAVSLSGRVGVGNIAGVAAAIGFGGPGAVFWMWVVAFLGASTAYVESTLGQIYKVEENGQYRGGPAYYFERCLGWRWLGILFAISAIVGCGIFLPGVQANAVGNAITQVFGEGTNVVTSFGEVGSNKLIGLAFILMILAFIIFGGIKRIANFTQIIVPFMALGYIVLALIVVFLHLDRVPAVFGLIFSDAFTAQAGFGAAIGWGVKRGIYSNEAGQGTGPHAAAAAEVEHPAQQGLVQAFSVYVDTLFVCTATALMILITQQYNIQTEDFNAVAGTGTMILQNIDAATEVASPAFTQLALLSVFGQFGQVFAGLAIFFFAFTTILA